MSGSCERRRHVAKRAICPIGCAAAELEWSAGSLGHAERIFSRWAYGVVCRRAQPVEGCRRRRSVGPEPHSRVGPGAGPSADSSKPKATVASAGPTIAERRPPGLGPSPSDCAWSGCGGSSSTSDSASDAESDDGREEPPVSRREPLPRAARSSLAKGVRAQNAIAGPPFLQVTALPKVKLAL